MLITVKIEGEIEIDIDMESLLDETLRDVIREQLDMDEIMDMITAVEG